LEGAAAQDIAFVRQHCANPHSSVSIFVFLQTFAECPAAYFLMIVTLHQSTISACCPKSALTAKGCSNFRTFPDTHIAQRDTNPKSACFMKRIWPEARAGKKLEVRTWTELNVKATQDGVVERLTTPPDALINKINFGLSSEPKSIGGGPGCPEAGPLPPWLNLDLLAALTCNWPTLGDFVSDLEDVANAFCIEHWF
jgi:hypothetical protein